LTDQNKFTKIIRSLFHFLSEARKTYIYTFS
jgi:hypothetical protein